MHAELLAGVTGLVVGAVVAAYALTVPANGPLPSPPSSLLARAQPRWVVGVGALLGCAASAVLVASLGWSWKLSALWLPGLLGVGLAIVDVRCRRLPFVMSGAMYVISGSVIVLNAVISNEPATAVRALVGCLVAMGLFLAVALAFPGQLGLGDVVVVGWVALTLAWLGWRRLGVGLLAGLLLQAAIATTIVALRRRRVDGGLPMGPALVAGWLVGVIGVVAG